jgi:cell division transport system ATP-binding protein
MRKERGLVFQSNKQKMIKFQDVTKIYLPKTVAVKNVNLSIEPGEFVSLVGASGAGKTTLAKLLIAQERPNTGSIIVGDWDITRIKRSEVPFLRRQIGVVFQDYRLLFHKTVFENVAFALEVCGASPRRIKEVVSAVLQIVGLSNKTANFPFEISGGEQQRVVIARALVHQPKIIIADEPTGNLDAINARDVIDTLLKINQFGTTVVLVTHNREIVNDLKKRVVVMHQGEIISDKVKGKYAL